MTGRVGRREWIFPLLIAALLLAIAWTPYGVAFRKTSPSDRFMGLIGVAAIDDNNVYLALMRQAAEGRFLFTNNYTPEPNPPALFNFIYLVLGRLAGSTGWSLDFVHRLFGGFSIVSLVLVTYAFIATAIRRVRYRRMALILACFSVGFVWVSRLVYRLIGIHTKTVDSWLVETSLFHAMLVYPHFVFAAALMVGCLLGLLKAERAGKFAPALIGGLCATILASSHTFEAVVLLPTAVAYVFLEWLVRERIPAPRRWLYLAAIVGLPLPVLLLNRWTLSREPMWGNVVDRLDFFTPDPFRLALGLGASLLIVLLTFDGFLRPNRSAGERMAKAWLLVALAVAYFPKFNWRWHLINGAQIPLAILATQGLRRTVFLTMLRRRRRTAERWWPGFLRGWRGVRAASAAAIVLCCLGSVNLTLTYLYEATQVSGPTYLPKTEVAALEWMGREIPKDALVLSTYPTGNYIPRLSGQRVFIGEDKLTGDLEGRQSDLEGFFRPGWSDEQRMDLLRRFGVDYVFYGPEERKVGAYDLSRASFLRPVHQEEDVQIFRVVGPEPSESRTASDSLKSGTAISRR
ncbi:MAG TPA: hypothetical protein VEW47_06355 [Candidatus Dormibacteraeota bacterium]|nr:hypothetical protein [Candidatus Dormibacteraeota bacterium]